MNETLHTAVLKTLSDRQNWEQRQRVWYQMRHNGLPRRHKPFKGAADLHFPLIDTAIEKLKPFYFSQVWGAPRLAEFVARDEQLAEATAAAADYLDWTLREETDLELELLTAIDWMLLSGRGILKVRWDTQSKRIVFEAVNPVFLIVPMTATTLGEADWVAHVKHLTLNQYRRDRRYTQAPELLRRIRGGADSSAAQFELQKSAREGLTYSRDEDTIVVWEVYEKTEPGWIVHTYSPNASDTPLRPPFQAPYRWRGRALLPFVGFCMEVKDKGWYSPRGVAERLAAFETSLCKTWNEKHDLMSFFNRPLFTSDSPIVNTGNIRFDPGMLLPPTVRPLPMPEPPMSFDADMQMTRLVAEQAVMMPDFGVGGLPEAQPNKTATEVNYIQTLSSTGVDLKGRVFHKSLGEVFRLCWAIILQYQREALVYFAAESRKVLPPQALHDNYLIQPEGSSDHWNKNQRIQRAAIRFQSLRGHPNVDQEELVKDLIQADDARLIRRLVVPTNERQTGEADAEATEIVKMMHGWPAHVRPAQDHQVRITTLVQFLQKQALVAAAPDPAALLARNLIQAHLADHLRMLQAQNPVVAGEIQAALARLEQQALPTPAVPASPPPAPGPAPDVAPTPQDLPGSATPLMAAPVPTPTPTTDAR